MTAPKHTPEELEVLQSIEQATATRRTFLGGAAAAVAAGAILGTPRRAHAGDPKNYAAQPPAGFTPWSGPGVVVKVKKTDCLQANGKYPKEDDAKEMLRRALQELTGKSDLAQAAAMFVHPQDKVCVKVNGIATEKMGTNRELVIPFLEAMIASGVPAGNITVLEQYGGFLAGTRLSAGTVPAGVLTSTHQNQDATMEMRPIPAVQRSTKFVRVLTESTALINFSLIKDHSICGYTGCLKNMTHGMCINPDAFHSNHASPHIALLAAQDVLRSRLRLNITDGFKVMAHGGPLWKYAQYVVPHEAVYVSTDAVAMDSLGWDIVEKERANFGLRTLTDEGRPPAYIQEAAELGLGIADRAQITFKDVTI